MKTRRSRGQASVEFTIFSVMLILSAFLIVQLAWIGIQKWQFNHFAAYTARVWSVEKDKSPNEAMIEVLAVALVRWNLYDRDFVKIMFVSSEDPKDVDGESANGLTFTGVSQLVSIYRDTIGETAFSVPSSVSSYLPAMPSTGLVRFETFIPVDKEPEENARKGRDNDCKETPCESGNKR